MPDRLQDLRVVDPILTTIARGYRNERFIAEALFPSVPMASETGQYYKFGREAFRIYQTERAIRARSNRMPVEGVTLETVKLEEHDIEYPIDYREDAESQFDLDARGTRLTTDAILLRQEKKAADLALNASLYAADHKITLAGAAQFSDAGSDPVGVFLTGKQAVAESIGVDPNTLLLGRKTYDALSNNVSLRDRIKYSEREIVTLDLMKALFDVENIVVGRGRYTDEAMGGFVDIWGDYALLAWVPQTPAEQRSSEDPSYGYTLRKTGNPVIDTYSEPGGKVRLVRNTDIFEVVLTGTDAGYLISDTVA